LSTIPGQPENARSGPVRDLLLKREYAKPGDKLVMTAGVPWEVSGSTNLIKVEEV